MNANAHGSGIFDILKSRRLQRHVGASKEAQNNNIWASPLREHNGMNTGYEQKKACDTLDKARSIGNKVEQSTDTHRHPSSPSDVTKAVTNKENSHQQTPPNFTPRRRRLRKLGRDTLMNFQKKKEMGKVPFDDLSDEDESQKNIQNQIVKDNTSNTKDISVDNLLESLNSLNIETSKGSPSKPHKVKATKHIVPERRLESVPKNSRDNRETSEYTNDQSSGTKINLPGGFSVQLPFELYPHQAEGISWLWNLHRQHKGGILADDMGLGKTMQISAFLSGIFNCKKGKRALIVAPKTLLMQWEKELTKCGLGHLVHKFYGGTANSRLDGLIEALQGEGIILTTYGMLLNNSAELKGLGKIKCIEFDDERKQVCWDYMILDEGHTIKNPKMLVAQKLKLFYSKHRIIVTGTPLQNNMRELHALMDFVCEGILGDRKQFREEFEKPITNGMDKNASYRERELGSALSAQLQDRISKYILRREKDKVFLDRKTEESTSTDSSEEVKESSLPTLADIRKNDLVIWLKQHKVQQKLYMTFLQTQSVFKALNNTGGSALSALTILKKICDHPQLLTRNAADDIYDNLESKGTADEMSWASKFLNAENEGTSCKINFLMQLLPELSAEGHRTLIFSQSRQMLDLIEKAIGKLNFKFCRIDGSISNIKKRQEEVDRFKNDCTIPVFLLTTRVGGLGLNLTEANRVIVVDPAWNPSVDNQSVDRAYRIGQSKNVLVYRLITCGTVEEKIYRKQVFKKALSIISNGGNDPTRYFTKQDLRELFSSSYEGFQFSNTQAELKKMHGDQRQSDKELDLHLDSLHKMDVVFGLSDHDLLFTKSSSSDSFTIPQKKAGPTKSSAISAAQSPMAKRMQSRSTWEGSSILSKLSLEDKASNVNQDVSRNDSKAESKTVFKLLYKISTNAVVEEEITDVIKNLNTLEGRNKFINQIPKGLQGKQSLLSNNVEALRIMNAWIKEYVHSKSCEDMICPIVKLLVKLPLNSQNIKNSGLEETVESFLKEHQNRNIMTETSALVKAWTKLAS